MKRQTSGCIRHVRERKRPRSGGTVSVPPSKCSSTDFDFGDCWQVLLAALATAPADAESYPRIVASRGDAQPQYEYEDEEPEPE